MLTKRQVTEIQSALSSDGTAFSRAFHALGDPCRFKIFKVLMRRRDICVTDIANICGVTLSAASQQLREIERAGLAQKTKMGQMVCYEINTENPIAKRLTKLLQRSR